jgi:nodulation protein E
MRRVAITGIGALCSLGLNVAEIRAALREGRCGFSPLQRPEGSLRFHQAAQICGYREADYFPAERAQLLDPFAQYALLAARQAVADSQVEFSGDRAFRTAVVMGSAMGGQLTEDAGYQQLYGQQSERVHPFTIPRSMACAAAGQMAMEFGIQGPVFTLSTACASATHAIGQAFWLLRSGAADIALTGGSEAPFSWGVLKAWEALRVVSPDTCRPFAKDRCGMILGEGAAVLVLEDRDAARARGAHIYAEIVGFGMSADAHHITQPNVGGPVAAMRAALCDARLAPAQVGYINAHGTGTPTNDPVEAHAIREVFAAHTARLPVSSTKSMHGHALGATGALEALATIAALEDGVLPPTINLTQLDPECDLDVVANQARLCPIDYALSNSFAFGGINAVLALGAAH